MRFAYLLLEQHSFFKVEFSSTHSKQWFSMRQLILEDETATELSALLTASLHESMSTFLSLQYRPFA